jgi:hypothetical protein
MRRANSLVWQDEPAEEVEMAPSAGLICGDSGWPIPIVFGSG